MIMTITRLPKNTKYVDDEEYYYIYLGEDMKKYDVTYYFGVQTRTTPRVCKVESIVNEYYSGADLYVCTAKEPMKIVSMYSDAKVYTTAGVKVIRKVTPAVMRILSDAVQEKLGYSLYKCFYPPVGYTPAKSLDDDLKNAIRTVCGHKEKYVHDRVRDILMEAGVKITYFDFLFSSRIKNLESRDFARALVANAFSKKMDECKFTDYKAYITLLSNGLYVHCDQPCEKVTVFNAITREQITDVSLA
jgi:hypothetical protein